MKPINAKHGARTLFFLLPVASPALPAPVSGSVASAGLLAGQPSNGQWSTTQSVEVPAAQNLRAFGRVTTQFEAMQSGTHNAWITTFDCETPAKAGVVAGKFLADLGLSPRVKLLQLPVDGANIPATQSSDGAIFVAFVNGAQARILCAATTADATAYLVAQPRSSREGAVSKAAYPTYLDRFDRYGWGFYGLDGYRSTHDWMNLAAKLDGKPGLKDPYEDFQWLVKLNNRFEPHLDPSGYLGNADGITANADDDWSVKLAKEQGLPISFRLYGSTFSDYHGWLLRRFGEYQNRPADFLTPRLGPYAVELEQSWFAPDAHKYQAVKAMDMVRKYAAEPHVTGWMHPYGEIPVGTWEFDHADFGPYAQSSWRGYLQKHGVDLAEATRLYDRKVGFGDWEQVPVPEFATFAGLDGQVLSLGGQWWSRPEVTPEQNADAAWWQKPEAERYQGLRDKWWQGAVDPAQWQLVRAPGGGGLPNKTSFSSTTWFRRSFALTPDQIKQGPLYLYWFPISHESVHSGANRQYHQIYINGERAGEVGTWGAIDVSKFLKAGDNQIALQLHANLWQGRIFLSTEAPRLFPSLGDGKNQLWVLWRQWLVDVPIQDINTVLDGMRQADADRPIKIMAPIHLGPSRYVKTARDYGAFPHFTGEGMWYFPWYKRYSYLYDVPGSSETAGPADPTDPECSNEFDAFRRVFMAGLNSHDPVFFSNTYSRSPYLRAWWEKHQAVLHQLGRYDLFGPQVLLFRSDLNDTGMLPTNPYPAVGDSARRVQTPWNWDLGRGTLQTLGQSSLYLDERGIADGKMNGYQVMIDGGNEIMTEESRRGIGTWVQAGGTFVALPFTGRSSLTRANTWHIQELTGCAIGKMRVPGHGTVTIKPDQKLFKACAGKVYPDKGSSMDWVGNELNEYSVELKPGADCEVLASYENGEPAVVKRRLGRGAVITFGSAFWRNSQDRNGIWWPAGHETEVLGDLLNGLGQPALCETDGQLIWPQPYRSNNGLDYVTCLVSWNETREVASKLRLRLPSKPAALMSFGVDGEHELPFVWKDGIAETKVVMPAREVKVVRALGTVPAPDAVNYWWNYQQRMWHELVKPSIDFAPYREGKFADLTLDLRPNARFASDKPASDAWMQPGFDDKNWTSSPMSLFRFWGAQPGKPLWVRKSFTVPSAWWQRTGQIRLAVTGVGNTYSDSVKVALNGTPLDQLGSGFSDGHLEIEARKVLRDTENVLTLEFAGKTPVQAVQGEVYLYFRPDAVKSLPLNPGLQTVFIPQSWEKQYRVMLYLEGERYAISGARVNDHNLGRGRPYPAPAEFNLSPYLKFGADNFITVNSRTPGDVKISRLDLFPKDE